LDCTIEGILVGYAREHDPVALRHHADQRDLGTRS
jgi:hypothetical protein